MMMLSTPDQPITTLTTGELEMLLTEIVRRVLREEGQTVSASENGGAIPEQFLATFGAWEDERPADKIIAELYESRTVSPAEASL